MGPELVSRWSAYFPPAPAEALFRWLANKDGQNKVLNLPISNVPGPREHGRVGGALVTEIYSVGPLTTGSGLNITVWSYVDQLNVSVLSDGATLGRRARADRGDGRGIRRNPPCRRAFRGADRRRSAMARRSDSARTSGLVASSPGRALAFTQSRKCPTAVAVKCAVRRAEEVEGVLGVRYLGVDDDLVGLRLECLDELAPLADRDDRVVLPCRMKNGGASGRTFVIGDASR